MRQAIICTNPDSMHWRIYAALGGWVKVAVFTEYAALNLATILFKGTRTGGYIYVSTNIEIMAYTFWQACNLIKLCSVKGRMIYEK